MPVMTTRLSWGSKVSSCDAICSALRDGARRCWGRCRLVGTSDITPAAQAIWRSIRPMVVQSLPAKLSAPPSCTGWTFLRPAGAARRSKLARAMRPRVWCRKTRGTVLGGLLLPFRRVIGPRADERLAEPSSLDLTAAHCCPACCAAKRSNRRRCARLTALAANRTTTPQTQQS